MRFQTFSYLVFQLFCLGGLSERFEGLRRFDVKACVRLRNQVYYRFLHKLRSQQSSHLIY